MHVRRENAWLVKRSFGLAVILVLPMAQPSLAATLTDSASRRIDVPAGIKAVVPAGPPAQVLLHALAPRLLAGLIEPFKPEHVIYVDPTVAALPQVPSLARTEKPGDVAMVADLKPGLSVDYGNVSPRYVAATEKIAAELHIPAVLYANGLADTGAVVSALGEALGPDARTKTIAAAVDDALAQVKSLADLPEAAKPRVYMARGADGLEGLRAGSSFDEPIRLAGGRNVVVGTKGPFVHLAVADVVALKPTVVVFGSRDALRSELRAALPKETLVVLDTGEPYKVLTGPPSINRIIGLVALAAILHPDTVKLDQDAIRRIETTLFPIPPGLAEPAPLQVQH